MHWYFNFGGILDEDEEKPSTNSSIYSGLKGAKIFFGLAFIYITATTLSRIFNPIAFYHNDRSLCIQTIDYQFLPRLLSIQFIPKLLSISIYNHSSCWYFNSKSFFFPQHISHRQHHCGTLAGVQEVSGYYYEIFFGQCF